MNYVASGYVRSGYVRQDNDTVDGVTFDRYGKHLYISEDVARINLTEVYTATKDWLVQDDNTRNLPPIRYSGYDPIPGGYTGATFFMINGWKLVYNPNTTAISGVLFSEDYDTGYWSYADLPIYPIMVSATVNTVYKEFGTSGLTEDESKKLSSIPTAEEIWAYVDRTLTESVSATVNAEDIWTHPTRSLTDGSGLDESQLHTALDAYSNKNLWKADTSNLITGVNVVEVNGIPVTGIDDFKANTVTVDISGLEAKVDAILVDTSDIQPRVIEIEERTADIKNHTDTLRNYTGLHAELDSYSSKDDWKADVSGIANDVSQLSNYDDTTLVTKVDDIKTVVDNTKLHTDTLVNVDIHSELDSYVNKDDWKADAASILSAIDALDVKVDKVNDALYGKWEIVDNQLIMYDDTNTVVRVFNLFDKYGNPTSGAVHKREVVS